MFSPSADHRSGLTFDGFTEKRPQFRPKLYFCARIDTLLKLHIIRPVEFGMANAKQTRGPDFLWPSFEAYLHSLTLTPSTIRNYLADVRDFARWMNRAARRTFNPRAFHDYREHLRRSSYARSTVNRRLHTLRLYNRFLSEQGLVARDPSAIESVAIQKGETAPRVLAADEVERLRAAVLQHARPSLIRRDRAIVELMLQAGLRVNEIAQLHPDSLAVTNQGLCLNIGTTGHSHQVPVHETLAHVLRGYLTTRPPNREYSSLFISQQGKPLSARAIQRLVEEYARAANLKEVSANTLRHTCAQNLLDAKCDPHLVAQWLGHRDGEMVKRYERNGHN